MLSLLGKILLLIKIKMIFVGEHGITYRLVESLCGTPETKVALCVNYSSIKKKTLKKSEQSDMVPTLKGCNLVREWYRSFLKQP